MNTTQTKEQATAATKAQLLDVSKFSPEKAVAALIDRAAEMKASDLFYTTNEQHLAVQVRH